MKPFSISAFLRFLVGMVAIVFAGTLAFHPEMIRWMQDHPTWDAIVVIAGIAFHYWNTYHHPEVIHGG